MFEYQILLKQQAVSMSSNTWLGTGFGPSLTDKSTPASVDRRKYAEYSPWGNKTRSF